MASIWRAVKKITRGYPIHIPNFPIKFIKHIFLMNIGSPDNFYRNPPVMLKSYRNLGIKGGNIIHFTSRKHVSAFLGGGYYSNTFYYILFIYSS